MKYDMDPARSLLSHLKPRQCLLVYRIHRRRIRYVYLRLLHRALPYRAILITTHVITQEALHRAPWPADHDA